MVHDLTKTTVRSGPGLRTELLQKLIDSSFISSSEWIVLFDNDCTFSLPSRTKFLHIAQCAELDVAGATMDVHQPRSFNHTVVRPFSMARQVKLVEIGPIVALSPNAQARILPFPDDAGLGSVLDVLWSTLGHRKGCVDAPPIRHHSEVGFSYETGSEPARMDPLLEAAGVESVFDLVRTLDQWRKWRARPKWTKPSTPLSSKPHLDVQRINGPPKSADGLAPRNTRRPIPFTAALNGTTPRSAR